MTTPWAHLPNAIHIDRIIESIGAHASEWQFVYSTSDQVAYHAAWMATLDDIPKELNVIKERIWGELYLRVQDLRNSGSGSIESYIFAAWSAMHGLIVFEESAHMLDSDVAELELLIALGHPYAILMLPAVKVLRQIESDCLNG